MFLESRSISVEKQQKREKKRRVQGGWKISHLPSNRYLAGAVPRGITGTALLYVLYKNSEQREILMMLLVLPCG